MHLSPRFNVLIVGLLCMLVELAAAHSDKQHRVTYITRIENARIGTPSQRIHAISSFELFFTLHDGQQDVKFTLEPNHDIIPEGAVMEHIDINGNVVESEPILRHEHKVFKGHSWLRDENGWYNAGWARVYVLKDGPVPMFEGAFSLQHDTHHILSRSNFLKTRHELDPLVEETGNDFMVVFRDSDLESSFRTQGLAGRGTLENQPTCEADWLGFNVQPDHAINRMISEPMPRGPWGGLRLDNLFVGGLTRRQTVDSGDYGNSGNSAGVNLKNTIGQTNGCPSTRQVALMGVATDCTYTGDFDSKDAARANVISVINSASDLYEKTFNLTLGLASLVTSDAECSSTPPESAKWNVPCSDNATITDRLNLFSQWRGTRNNDTNAFWSLLTTCETGSAVGLSWLGQLCQKNATQNSADQSWVSGANVIARTSTEWKVIAHEIGHTMGAVHDCTSDTCSGNSAAASMCCPLSTSTCNANGQYIMNPSTSDQIENFSPCTVGNICSAFLRKSVDTSCLTSNKGITTITEHECGNGIVEEGEECDCGGTSGCDGNTCCNPTTCKFTSGSVCDDANEDCCKSCQFAPVNTVCRASNGVCDPQEVCTGKNSTCPADVTAPNGQSCGSGLQCASGQCTSRNQQCQTVMGQYSSNNDTKSCDDDSCVISCASPEFGANTCFYMQQNFLDGTPCSGDGTCKNGQCSGASTLGAVKSWFEQHKAIVIGVASGIGALLLLSILSCCFSRCRRRQRLKGMTPPNRGGWQQPSQQMPYAMPQPMADDSGYPGYNNQYQSRATRYA